MEKVKGRARRFGDNIDTDTITPGSLLHLPVEELRIHAFEPIRPGFSRTVREGDIIVGGNNFGCGSSREQATSVVKELGIRTIACDSMARIYFRNCIALGVYPIIAKGVAGLFEEGDEMEIDLEAGQIINVGAAKSTSFEPLSGTPCEILNGGGILPFLKRITEGKS